MEILSKEHGFDEPIGLLSDCHRRVERFLQILHKVADDAPKDELPKLYHEGLESALDYFAQAAPKHTEDEEDSLFPRIVSNQQAAAIIAELEGDHEKAGPLHETVEAHGRQWLADGQLKEQHRAEFSQAVEALVALYKGHIETEDTVLFPLAKTLLGESEISEIGAEMATRRGLTPNQSILDFS